MILATGAAGMVGSYLPETIMKTDIDTLDVSCWKEIANILSILAVDIIFHLAAETDVDSCEENPDQAYQTNVVGTMNIARHCRARGIKLVYVATAQGEQTIYGRTKKMAEWIIRDLVKDHLIVRAGWMFGGGEIDKKFVGRILKIKGEIKAVSDIYGCPTYAKDLIFFILNHLDLKGTVNFANGVASRYEMAKFIFPDRVVPISKAIFPAAARREDEVMSNFICPRGWQEALAEYLEEMKK